MTTRKSIISIAVCLSFTAVLLLSLAAAAQAQPKEKYVLDTGVVSLGANQVLRITVTQSQDSTGTVSFRIGKTSYSPGGCNPDGVCQLVGTNTFTGPMTLMPGRAATYDALFVGTYGRGVVISNSRNLQVRAAVVNSFTGEVVTQIIMANTEGDFH